MCSSTAALPERKPSAASVTGLANPTILSGDIGTVGVNGDNSNHVVYVDGVTYENITGSSVIDGFTITAGKADGDYPHYLGGGLYCAGSGSGKSAARR